MWEQRWCVSWEWPVYEVRQEPFAKFGISHHALYKQPSLYSSFGLFCFLFFKKNIFLFNKGTNDGKMQIIIISLPPLRKPRRASHQKTRCAHRTHTTAALPNLDCSCLQLLFGSGGFWPISGTKRLTLSSDDLYIVHTGAGLPAGRLGAFKFRSEPG